MIELKNFTFKRNSLGYEYLLDAISIVFRNKMAIKDFKKYVYTPIAKKYHTKPQNVFWCLEKIISLMFLNTDLEIIENYFSIDRYQKISTKAFIVGIARKMQLQKEICQRI